MRRRAFLSAATGLLAATAGCTRRRTVRELSAEPTVPEGEFYHEPLDFRAVDEQYTLQYTVTADGPFDVFLFGGRADPGEFGRYRAAVRGEGDVRPTPSAVHSSLGATGTAEVDRTLAPGLHHFVVDNTRLGEATPDGTLRAGVTLEVSDFEFGPG